MLDVYLRGDVDRISPEAPVPVVRVRERRHALGGAANVAQNVAALGAGCDLVAAIGRRRGRRYAARHARATAAWNRARSCRCRGPPRPRPASWRARSSSCDSTRRTMRTSRTTMSPACSRPSRPRLPHATRSCFEDYNKGVLVPRRDRGRDRAGARRAASRSSSTRSTGTSSRIAARPFSSRTDASSKVRWAPLSISSIRKHCRPPLRGSASNICCSRLANAAWRSSLRRVQCIACRRRRARCTMSSARAIPSRRISRRCLPRARRAFEAAVDRELCGRRGSRQARRRHGGRRRSAGRI